jgi:hypothetical protein
MEKPSSHSLSPVQADDVASLKEHLPDGKFDYVDVAAAQAHLDVLRRWPLLAEIDAGDAT